LFVLIRKPKHEGKLFMISGNECSPISRVSDRIVENLLLLFNVTSLILIKGTVFPLIGS